MFELLKKEDREFLGNVNLVKNAMFYKDLLAFCAAFEQIRDHDDELPNYCYLPSGELCLEGICLMMKMYATEFRFETLKLTLDYLKILYYCAASYADEDGFVDQMIIRNEVTKYQDASQAICNQLQGEINEKLKESGLDSQNAASFNSASKISKTSSRALSILSVVFVACFIVSAILLGLEIGVISSHKMTLILTAVVCGVCFGLSILFRILSKYWSGKAGESSYVAQNGKRASEEKLTEIRDLQTKYNKVVCEKFEFRFYFSEYLGKNAMSLSFDQIMQKAREYKLLSYNIVYDINRIFKSQQMEIDRVITDIDNITFSSNHKDKLASSYAEILDQDWLLYNAEVRLHFLKKIGDLAERSHDWKLEYAGEKIDPFGIKIKDLSREKVAYLKSKNSKFVAANLADISRSNLMKNDSGFSFNGQYTLESLKNVKANYLTHFCNFMTVEESNFYSTKNNKAGIDEESIKEDEWVPAFVNIKLKLIENEIGMGNSDTQVIQSMARSLFAGSEIQVESIPNLSEQDIDYPKFEADTISEDNEKIIYTVAGNEIVGYKI